MARSPREQLQVDEVREIFGVHGDERRTVNDGLGGDRAAMARERRKSAVYEPDYQYLLTRVREARKERGLTQVEVAAALGRPTSFVSKVELGERRIDPIDLQAFAELYEKPFEYFLPPRRRGSRKSKD